MLAHHVDSPSFSYAMQNDAHITRRADWTDDGAGAITPAEWDAIVRDDPELIPDKALGDHAARWTGGVGAAASALVWRAGNIDASEPDANLLRKMLKLATKLGAAVQNDDGDRYPDGESAQLWQSVGSRAKTIWERRTPTHARVDESRFRIGMKVRDPKLGLGEVVGFDTQGGMLSMIRVRFADGHEEARADAAPGVEPVD